MLYIFGDTHLSDDRPWSFAVAEKILNFIIAHPSNNKENEAVFLGDLTETATMNGNVFYFLVKLFSQLKYRKVYVLVGNHDIKTNKNGDPVLSFQFLKQFGVEIISSYKVLDIEDMKVLALPFVFPDGKNSVNDYENLPKEISDVNYDIVVGHFADTSVNTYPGKLIDIGYLKSKFYALGHIHNPETRYVGSMSPNNIAESGKQRYIRSYSKEKGETLLDLPSFCEYYTVKFPEELSKPKEGEIPIYTVYNCSDEAIATQKYGNIFIRKCVYDVTLDTEAFAKLGQSLDKKDTNQVSIKDMYMEWFAQSSIAVGIKEKAQKYLFEGN